MDVDLAQRKLGPTGSRKPDHRTRRLLPYSQCNPHLRHMGTNRSGLSFRRRGRQSRPNDIQTEPGAVH